MNIRKILFVKEIVEADGGERAPQPISRVAALAVLANPLAGRYQADVSALFDIGLALGERLAAPAVALLDRPALCYGKSAIVGVNGEVEHAAALLHPKLGRAMRNAVGGGEAIIPSTQKVAAAGATIDVPLSNKDNIWSFNELDTITVTVPDGPKPDEIVAILAFADGGRALARSGDGPIRD